MRPIRWVAAVAFGLSAAALLAQDATRGVDSRVTVPLSEYEALKKAQERTSVTVVDTLRLGGSFKARDLSILFSGRSAGSLPAIDVLTGTSGIVLYGCDGEGIISRGTGGAFQLTPLAARFAVRCKLAVRGSDRLEMTSPPSVLWVESDVADGELVPGQEGGDGKRQFSVVRRVTVAAEGLKSSATGRYKITLGPDETRFHYEIQVHNPNRSRQAFDVTLASGEHLQQVDAQVPYDAQEQRYRFDVPPGDATLKLSGSLSGTAFRPPVEASLQYCLIESHPLLRPMVGGAPKRVSPQEVGIATEYRGAQAFLVTAGETLSWTVTKLEALRTTSFSVTRVEHVFFLSADGPALGQSDITIDNQGAPDVSLPMAAEPTFASLQAEPVFLTKDAQGSLWLPIGQGTQALSVQHRQPFRRVPGFGLASLALPQMPVPATRGELSLRYPSEWFPIYESFVSEARFWTPPAGALLGALLLFVWTERMSSLLGLALRRRALLAAALTLAALSWGWALLALVAANLAVTSLRLLPWIRARWSTSTFVLLGIGAVSFLLMLMIAIPSLMRARVAPTYPSSRAVPQAPAATSPGPAEQYQGLPAKFELPAGAHRTYFSTELLDTDATSRVRVLMVSGTLLGWLQSLVVLLAGIAVWRERAALAKGWQSRRAAPATPAEPGRGSAQQP